MNPPPTCPRCGTEKRNDYSMDGVVYRCFYNCHSTWFLAMVKDEGFTDSMDCLRRQLKQAREAIRLIDFRAGQKGFDGPDESWLCDVWPTLPAVKAARKED